MVGGPKNEKIINLFFEGHIVFVINSCFLPILDFFDDLFFAPQDLKRAIIFLKRATFGPRAMV